MQTGRQAGMHVDRWGNMLRHCAASHGTVATEECSHPIQRHL